VLIIDSLLNFNFFSLERCGEPLSFLPSGTRSQFHRAELGSVVGVIGTKHRKEGVEQFSHYSYKRLQPSLAAIH